MLGALGLLDTRAVERRPERQSRNSTDYLFDVLSEADCVLIVDNCEHLIGPVAALVDQLLAACPDLRILTTSREPLGIVGEALCLLPPLGLPPVGVSAADALEYPAVRLLIERAQAVSAGFTIDDNTVDDVTEIVRRLDGLPLAIELAAARLRVMPIGEIATRLSDRFRLLTGGSRTAMPRHRTLRAVVEWSWDLLAAD
jgi:predicted ATPase